MFYSELGPTLAIATLRQPHNTVFVLKSSSYEVNATSNISSDQNVNYCRTRRQFDFSRKRSFVLIEFIIKTS